MRNRLITAALAASLASSPAAAADITARYEFPAATGHMMTVQANDRGDSRLSFGERLAVVTRDGVSYLLMADLRGPFAIRQDEMVAAMAEMVRGMASDVAPPPEPVEAVNPYSPTEAGTETVAGRTGTVWRISPPSADEAAGRRGPDIVISTDADLAPIGRALARQWVSGDFVSGNVGLAGSLAFFPAAVRSIVERGTIIRMGTVMRLHSVEPGPVPDSAFTLPGPVLTRSQFLARSGFIAPRPD